MRLGESDPDYRSVELTAAQTVGFGVLTALVATLWLMLATRRRRQEDRRAG